ncbi:2Fe-2S ferredoxin [Buchnera aphidicola (Schlechtendalia chinensis)]|uniref:2Fe-2S ferredoxin n=1 Tax=Buchnera aphidicola subsp. Schlechtendalia chinensis TaxID=118110 RepID=A0A172WE72_BUCSC|nr:ISC system 2Fe-2S type ferredoxin [Buchnera aphidicola]ANF17290.1 2Fe-2S ferredoxin [Buchnera aphidicola (Schlechtendalia chinensis)]
MPKIKFLPHKLLLPKGGTFYAKEGETILNVALRNNINIEHACNKSCICTTCHCFIEKGYYSLSPCEEKEEDILDKAWGIQINSRLSCQAKIKNQDIEVKIPMYTINQF